MSRIKTYEDLEAEEKRLQALLYSHRESLKDSAVNFKESLNPFKMAIGTVGKLFHRDKSASPLANFGLYMGIDVLVRRFLLAKSGWFTKIIVPFIIKNYSTHLIKQKRAVGVINKIKSFFTDGKVKTHNVKEDVKNAAKDTTTESVTKDVVTDVKDSVKETTRDVQQSLSNKT